MVSVAHRHLRPRLRAAHGRKLQRSTNTLKNPIEVEEVRIRQARRTRRYQSQKRKEKKIRGADMCRTCIRCCKGGTCAVRHYLTHGQQAFTGPCHSCCCCERPSLFHSKPSDRLPKSKGFDGESHWAVRGENHRSMALFCGTPNCIC